jgi:anti-sigma-K factor RskA
MDDLLIGYVLGALSAEETADLELRLKNEPALQQRLEIVRRAVRPLTEESNHAMPADLAARTCRLVREQDDESSNQ